MKRSITGLLLFAFVLGAAFAYSESEQEDGPFGRGKAWKRHTIDDASRGSDGTRLMDVNGDGLLDVTTGWEEGGQVRVCLHPGHDKVRQKWPSVCVGKVKSPEDAVFVDLDNDGAVDVVSSCEGRTNQVFVHWAPKDKNEYLNEEAWKTESFPQVKGVTQWMFAAPAQIDKHNGVDLFIGSKNKNGRVGWLESPASPRDLSAWKYHHLCNAGWIMSLVAEDMDGDGDQDVLVSDRRGKQSGCLWIENPYKKSEQAGEWVIHRIGPAGGQVMFLDLADLDGDGLKDVLVPTFDRHLYVHRQVKQGATEWDTRAINFPKNTGSGKAVRVADVNLDGKLDIILACANANKGSGLVWLSYKKSVNDTDWDVHEIAGLPGIKFDLIQMIDLDGDGDLDAMNNEERTGNGGLGVFWYENPTK